MKDYALMNSVWLKPAIIIGAVFLLLTLNAREFKFKRAKLEMEFPAAASDDIPIRLARAQAFQSLTLEQLLHMIHTMLAAILAALLWR